MVPTHRPSALPSAARQVARTAKRQAKRAWRSLWFGPDLIRSTWRLRRLERQVHTEGGRLAEIPVRFEGWGEFAIIRPKQVPWEITQLLNRLMRERVQAVCEIGTFRGGTFYLWCQAAADEATLIAVDLPGEESLDLAFSKHRIEFYRRFAKTPKQTLHFLAADSHAQTTAHAVARLLGPRRLDFLFIDGDHTYEGVKRDVELYRPLVRPGGLIALHDILPRRQCPEIQVYRFWDEVRRSYASEEIVAPASEAPEAVGIGLLRVP